MEKRLEIIALIGLVGLLTGCASQMVNEEGDDWSWYGRLVNWASPWHGSDAELIEPTELVEVGIPEAELIDEGLASQRMRINYPDGQYIEFAMNHNADHWGEVGTGAGIVNGASVNVNVELRKRSEIAIGTTVAIPNQDYDWREWRTENGKSMYMSDGIDLYGLKVAISYAHELGVVGDPVSVQSVEVIYD